MKNLLQRSLHRKQSGFTLIELLIVMLILVVLLALILPIVFGQQERMRKRQAAFEITQFDRALLEYKAEHGDYPFGNPSVPRSGLAVLAGEVNPYQPYPMGGTTMPGQTGMIPGGSGMPGGPTAIDGGMGFGVVPGDPTAMGGGMGFGGVPGDPTALGGGMEQTRSVGSPMNPQGGTMNLTPMTSPAGGVGGAGFGGVPGGPTAMDGGMGFSGVPGDPTAMGGGMGSANATAGYNPSQTQGRGATQNYLGKALPKDPWGQEYFYEYPTNKRPNNSMPAIWSAGKDGISETDDDVINWEEERKELEKDPAAMHAFLQRSQQGVQPQGAFGTNIPGVQPTMPGVQPTMPGVQPTMPGVQPTMPGVQPTMPGVQPTMPGVQPTMPGVQPTMPGVQPTMPGVQPIPGTNPIPATNPIPGTNPTPPLR